MHGETAYWLCDDCKVWKLCKTIGGAYSGQTFHRRKHHSHRVHVHYYVREIPELQAARRLR